MTLLEVNNLKKIYSSRFGGASVQALSNVTLCQSHQGLFTGLRHCRARAHVLGQCSQCGILPRLGDDFAEVAGQKAKELQAEMAAELAKL